VRFSSFALLLRPDGLRQAAHFFGRQFGYFANASGETENEF